MYLRTCGFSQGINGAVGTIVGNTILSSETAKKKKKKIKKSKYKKMKCSEYCVIWTSLDKLFFFNIWNRKIFALDR